RKVLSAARSFEIAKTAILSPLRGHRNVMNSQDSSANPKKIVSAEYVPPISLHRFCRVTGLSKASAWRYERRGWLRPHLIANRRYVLADVAEFNRTLASDDFAGSVSNLSAARQSKAKKRRAGQLMIAPEACAFHCLCASALGLALL